MELASLLMDLIKTIVYPFLKILKWVYEKLPFQIVSRKPIPKLGIIESSWKDHRWGYAKKDDEKVVIIYAHWKITNTLPYNLTALNAFLIKPERVKGSIMTKDSQSNYWGSYPIPRGYTTEMETSFVINHKYIKHSDDLIKAKIEVQDPTGRIHKINEIIVRPVEKVLVKKEQLVVEDSSRLSNEIERQVVAILKNEVQQYKFRGRREGRLGTVEWPHGTNIDYHEMDSKIQYLFENSNKENVSSEHITALRNLFRKSSSNQRRIIIKSLLDRIDKKSEYRDVGYLIIFFLFEIGHLKDGLDTTLKKLRRDKANGFGDVLRILDILLAFRFKDFKGSDLDAVEKFTYSIKEHSFNIRERVNAIRVRKMLGEDKAK